MKTPILILLFLFAGQAFGQTAIQIDIDATKAKIPVSPFIYGKNNVLPSTYLSGTNADITKAKEAGVKFVRQGGGNNSTKYNWRLKLSSHPDWYNNVYANDWDAAAKNMFDKMPGVHGMWSFQLLGKAAANTKNNFPDWTYNQSQWWEGVAQNLAGGGQVNATGTKAKVEGNPDLYLMNWTADSTVGILDKWFGAKGLGYDKNRLRYWSMDNEPEIWSGTHDDVMKTQCTAEEFMQLYFKVAKAARAKFPDIKLSGPVPANEWQWYKWGSETITYNGKKYCWLEYFILRVSEEEKATGIKLLNVLDIHYYPGSSDPATCVQFHRVFFDRNYVYPEANGLRTLNGGWDTSLTKEYILGRCSDWLVKYMGANHGVGLGLTETALNSSNANVLAVWYGSTMGEFMKNGVEIFTPWSWKVGMWETLHLFSRYNQENYVQATSQNESLVSAYPTMNQSADSMTVVVINRSLTEKKTVLLTFAGYLLQNRAYSMYSLSGLPATETFVSHTSNKLVKKDVVPSLNQITVELEPLSVNSIILKAAPTSAETKALNDKLKTSVFPNPATDQVNIVFSVPQKGKITIGLYQANGALLNTIADQIFDSGDHQIEFNTAHLASGIYLIKVRSGNDNQTLKLIKN
ncbi:MAG: T9SS type A sorting domain-containing protein [Prolixibacteraceae bacterium]|nr:T9SS type A sorting domain-containing protein [Prolixibacteraceae bacterium]